MTAAFSARAIRQQLRPCATIGLRAAPARSPSVTTSKSDERDGRSLARYDERIRGPGRDAHATQGRGSDGGGIVMVATPAWPPRSLPRLYVPPPLSAGVLVGL